MDSRMNLVDLITKRLNGGNYSEYTLMQIYRFVKNMEEPDEEEQPRVLRAAEW